ASSLPAPPRAADPRPPVRWSSRRCRCCPPFRRSSGPWPGRPPARWAPGRRRGCCRSRSERRREPRPTPAPPPPSSTASHAYASFAASSSVSPAGQRGGIQDLLDLLVGEDVALSNDLEDAFPTLERFGG